MAKRVNLLEGNIALSLTKLSLPLMGMSCLQMAYNLTDIFWIGKLGSGPVASVGTGGLLIWLSTGIHTLAQLGGQVYVAQNLGAGNKKDAAKFAHASIFLSTCISIILALIFTIFINPVISIFNLNDETVIKDATSYVMITCGLIFFQLMSKLLTAIITTTGDSRTPFIATTVGLIFNMFLDPMLIFGFGFIPALGVVGAAIATVFAQVIVFTFLFIYALKDKHLFDEIKIKTLPELNKIKQILKLSFPTAMQASLFPLISIFISRMVASFGDGAVAVQRIGSQIESLSWMATDGFAIAVNSFIAQNYGAKNIKRAKSGFYQSLLILSVYGLLVTLLLVFAAEPIFSIFIKEEDIISMGADYLVILGFSQVFLCLEILSSSSMNAFGKTMLPSVVSIIFTAIRIPLAIALIATPLALNGIWLAVSLSTVLKGSLLLLSIILFLKIKFKDYTRI